MKATITTTETKKQEIDIETPAYFKDHYNRVYKIDDDKITGVTGTLCFMYKKDEPFSGFYSSVKDAVNSEKSNAGEFQNVLNVFLDNLNL